MTPRVDSVERVWLIIAYAISVAALTGFATFTMHPSLLVRAHVPVETYARMMLIAPRAQIVIAFVVLAIFLSRRVGRTWLMPFGLVYALSLGAELAGTTVGLPFGPYRYTEGLGWKWLQHVPVLIPASWFMMALPSYAIATWRFPFGDRIGSRIALGSFVLLSWDLALDPAMSLATKYWVWGTNGPYYGMPLLNLVGWFVTGVALMVVLVALRVDRWIERLPPAWLLGYYGANLLLPVGITIASGMWGAVAATAIALGAAWVTGRASERRAGRAFA